jgi:DNA-binding transcriptional MerR regulator
MNASQALWTLDELCAQVALALAVDYAGANNGRVRDVPDRRTVRYYTTLRLIDRPAATRGRTALYRRRHLLQLAAIKRLQARGMPLAEVQARLLGLTDAALEAVAALPADFEMATPTAAHATAEASSPRRDDFWRAEPEPVRSMTAVTLDDRVTLLLEATRALDEHDLSALRAAAAPLLKLLQVRRLLGAERKTSSTKEELP